MDLATFRVQLKLEVFWSSRLLKNHPYFKAKVGVRLKLEIGFYGTCLLSIMTHFYQVTAELTGQCTSYDSVLL